MFSSVCSLLLFLSSYAVEGVEDDPCLPEGVEVLSREDGFLLVLRAHVAAQVHVVGGVERELHVVPLGHVAEGVKVVEACGHSGGHDDQVVGLLDDLVGVVDEVLSFPGDGDDELGLGTELLDGLSDLLVLVRGTGIGLGPDHLDFQGGECEIVNILDSVLQGATLTGQRDSGGTVSYHGQSLMPRQPCQSL